MSDARIAPLRRVRVNRPRSKHHGVEGEITLISVDAYKSPGAGFHWNVTIDHTTTVPLGYLEIEVDGEWLPALDLEGDPPL